MKFLITRSSINDDKIKPCIEAKQETYIRTDEKTSNDPFKIFKGKDWWHKDGKNHRIENGHIMKRDFDEIGWFIELKNLDELLKFHKKYGDLSMTTLWGNQNIINISICDEELD